MTRSYRDNRPPLPAGIETLPASFYTDAEQLRRELEAIHFRMWICAGRTEDLPEPGSYFVRRLGGANAIVVRGERGELAAFHNSCRHRGTILCKEEQGKLRGRIHCPYHAWTYALDGRLLGAPHMDKVAGFRVEDYPLVRIHVAEWDGHVFLNFSDRPGTLETQLAGLDRKFRAWRMGELRRVERRVYPVQANWKLIVQNYSECLHCAVAHPLLNKLSHYLSGENEPPRPTYLGGSMDLYDGVATLSVDGRCNRDAFAGLDAADKRRVYFYALLPNFLLSLHPDYMLTTVLWPCAADRTEIVCEWHFHPGDIAKPEFDPRGAIDFWDVTNREDWELSEQAQAGIASRGYRIGPYSSREELLHAFDRWVIERVGEAG